VSTGNIILRCTGTFSLVARFPETAALGVCVSTAFPAVGSVVPYAEPEVGAIATQGYTNVLYGIEGLKLLRRGSSPQETLEALLKEDPKKEMRQVSILDASGRKAVFTGRETLEWRGDRIGEDCIAAGNALVSGRVLDAMLEAFENSAGWLADRLMRALEAAQEAGGDRRGKMSAALLIVEKEPILETRPFLSLRVDMHEEPIQELRRIFEDYKKWAKITR